MTLYAIFPFSWVIDVGLENMLYLRSFGDHWVDHWVASLLSSESDPLLGLAVGSSDRYLGLGEY